MLEFKGQRSGRAIRRPIRRRYRAWLAKLDFLRFLVEPFSASTWDHARLTPQPVRVRRHR